MTRPLRVALLGCGRIAELFHLPILAGLNGVVLASVAEPDAGRRKRAAALVPAALVVDDYRDAIDDSSTDAVVICLPSGLHADAACAAFAAGRHVYLEKPLATSLEDAQRVREAWRSGDAVGMIGFNQRFDPMVTELKRMLDEERLGVVTTARLALGAAAREIPVWKRDRATGGGVLLDLGSHAFDLTRFVLGQEITSVSATVMSARFEDDTAAVTLTVEDGRLVDVHLAGSAAQESRCELLGDGGRLVADRYAGTIRLHPPLPPYAAIDRVRHGLGDLGRLPRRLAAIARPPRDALSYRRALLAFTDASSNGQPTTPDLEDGYRSLVVVHAAEESARSGRRIEIAPEG